MTTISADTPHCPSGGAWDDSFHGDAGGGSTEVEQSSTEVAEVMFVVSNGSGQPVLAQVLCACTCCFAANVRFDLTCVQLKQ